MKITIETVKHDDQRYDTIGDWQFDAEGNLKISVSEMTDIKTEFLIGLHEMIEAMLCADRNILEESVDKFDIEFMGDGEPGADGNAPYHKEHVFAENIERLVAHELGIDWHYYNV